MARKFRVNKDRHMVVTPVVRLSFPQLFTPRSYKDDPDAKKIYRCDLIFTPEQVKEKYEGKKTQTVSLLAAKNNAAFDMWGPDKKKWPRFNHPAIKKGDTNTNSEGEIRNGYEGMYFVSPKTGEKYPPKIVGRDGREITEKDLYGGCWVRAQIVASAYETGANKGVTFYLNQVMKVKDGERFGGVPDDVFDVSEIDDNEDSWDEAEAEDRETEDEEF